MADGVSAGAAVVQTLHPFFEFFVAQAAYISNFEDNLEDLRTALGDLEARRDGVVRRVDAEEIKGQEQKKEVERWLSKVHRTIAANTLLIREASLIQQKLSACGCCPIFSVFFCGKRIVKMLEEVRSLMSDFSEVTEPPPLPVVQEEPLQQTFGLDTKLDSTWSRLIDDRVRTLGIYGMAGVGKTALLNLIENKFVEVKTNFDVIIWVEVHEDADIGKIQNEIGNRLGLYDEKWSQKPPRERASDIRRVLKKKPRFVLLLDDLWKEVNLSAIGIPVRETKYKVVFTTRDKEVCISMRANELIEVERLAEEDALCLLKINAGIDTLEDEMLGIAKDIVEKCLGLPIVLEVIGKCLSSRGNADGWRYVLSTLDGSSIELKGITQIFSVLKSSYDNLDEVQKLCLKYCALFPEAYKIRKDELVEYWIGEGILDEERGRQRAKDRGCEIIRILVNAWFLLEDGEPAESKPKVFMRGLIREMALWIVMSDGDKFVVSTDAEISSLPKVKNWRIVTKISVMNSEIMSITDPPSPNPHRLVTLFLQNNKLVDIVGRFFQILSTIVVLDLSCNPGITDLPEEIALLVSLRYLNLLKTRIKSLPKDFKKLIGLIHLDLESTFNLQDISPISALVSLQVLRFYGSASLYGLLLKSLELMTDLKLLTITIEEDLKVLEEFLGSKMAGHTEGLYLDRLDVSGVSGKSFAATFGELDSLSKLGMTECNIIESEMEWEDNTRNQYLPSTSTMSNTWFKNLSAVVLSACINLKDVTWLIYATNLESLSVKNSHKMEELIRKDKAGEVVVEPFVKLQVLELEYLDVLKSIYWSPLSFPKLQKVQIKFCPKLFKLPLSDEKIDALHIKLDEEWWLQGVEWERGAT